MLKDCLEIFKKELDKKGDKLILDSYIPADGTYIIVSDSKDSFAVKEVIEFKLDKKTRTVDKSSKYYETICQYDYNSKLISMNKPIDGKKIIHSNNYLSFFVKKDSLFDKSEKGKIIPKKLTEEIINKYYEVLKDPFTKYPKSKKASYEAYTNIESEIGVVNTELVEKIQRWIKENIFIIAQEHKGKDYLKIFFEAENEEYEKEGRRYFVPNIYNSNDYNRKSQEKIIGLPNNNMGMNSKKPYLENKTRPEKIPYLIDNDEVMLQKKFFDYLLNQACLGKGNIYLGESIIANENKETIGQEFSGIFIRISKGMELEIQGYDVITNYNPKLLKKFNYMNILGDTLDEKTMELYGKCDNRKKLQLILDNILFSKYLMNNYFTEPKDMSINDGTLKRNLLVSRDAIFNWIYKGYKNGIDKVLDKVTLNITKGSIEKGYFNKAKDQFNLRWSFKNYFNGGINMADIVYEMQEKLRNKINALETEKFLSDDEYYFAVGQLVNYLLSLSKGKSKPQSLLNPFINAKNNEIIREKLRGLYLKYNYEIEQQYKRFNNLYGMIVAYLPEGKVNQDMILAGYLRSNLLYEKMNKEDK